MHPSLNKAGVSKAADGSLQLLGNVFDVAVIKLKDTLSMSASTYPQFTTRGATEFDSVASPYIFYGAGPSIEGGSDNYAIRTYVPISSTAVLGSAFLYEPTRIVASKTMLDETTEQCVVRGDSGGPQG